MSMRPGFFDLDGDDTVFGDLAEDGESEKARGGLFAVAPSNEILGSRFNDTQSGELAAINANNPQLGVKDFSDLINARLDDLLGNLLAADDRLSALLVELVGNPEALVNTDLLQAIEEFVETSKYALLTFEAMQRKVERHLSSQVVEGNSELTTISLDLSRLIHERLAQRTTRHDELVKIIGQAAQSDEQLTALVKKVYADLGVVSDNDFNEDWLALSTKKFVTLPEEQIEFLKRFDEVLIAAVKEAKEAGLYESTQPKEKTFVPDQPQTSAKVREPLLMTLQGTYMNLRNRFSSFKFSIKKAAVVAVAIGATATALVFGVKQSGSQDEGVSKVDPTEITDDASSNDLDALGSSLEETEPINPLTNKPFTQKEIEFLDWVSQQVSLGYSEIQISEMFENLMINIQQNQTPVEIGEAVVESNTQIQSRRTGGDASRRSQVSARSSAARRNSEARANIPTTTALVAVPTTEPAPTITPEPAPTTTSTTVPNVPEESTTTTTATTTTIPDSSTSTTLVPAGLTVSSNPVGLEPISIEIR